MCISNQPATFNNTKGYIGRTKNNTIVMAYQMDAQAIGDGMRAIILQIPAKKIVKIHDTSTYNKFLTEIFEQSGRWTFDQNGVRAKQIMRSKSIEIKPTLEKVGMYNVVVLNSYAEFEEIENYFPADLAPKISADLIAFYEEYYGDWKFVVATFDNQKQMSSQPFLIEYESLIHLNDESDEFKEIFIFPALDNGDEKGFHSGIPKINQFIREDHFICFPHEKGLLINFSQNVPSNLISNRVGFYNKHEKSINGDFIVFPDGQPIIKHDAAVLGKMGLENILNCPQMAEKTNAFTNW